MTNILLLDRNKLGRDFVVGDIHGNYSAVMDLLREVEFDYERDRLLSVGDLIDRGADSLQRLSLLQEPWFYCIMGNHEQHFIDDITQLARLLETHDDFDAAFATFRNGYSDDALRTWGSGWYVTISGRGREEFSHLVKYRDALQDLPLVILVGKDSGKRYQVVHAELFHETTGRMTDDFVDMLFQGEQFNLVSDDDLKNTMLYGGKIANWWITKWEENGSYQRALAEPNSAHEIFLELVGNHESGRSEDNACTTFCGHFGVSIPDSMFGHVYLDTSPQGSSMITMAELPRDASPDLFNCVYRTWKDSSVNCYQVSSQELGQGRWPIFEWRLAYARLGLNWTRSL